MASTPHEAPDFSHPTANQPRPLQKAARNPRASCLPGTVRTFGCSWSACSGEDYDLVLAPNAEDALDRLDTGPFDLLLLDIKLGDGKSGTELLHLLRERTPAQR